MNNFLVFLGYLIVGALVTYLLRMVPMIFFRKKIKNRFLRSLLHYIPFAVLTAMTVPAVFYSSAYTVSAIVGTLAAVIIAYFNRGLVTVAAGASAAVLICEIIIKYCI